jgi:hypothetical protein
LNGRKKETNNFNDFVDGAILALIQWWAEVEEDVDFLKITAVNMWYRC